MTIPPRYHFRARSSAESVVSTDPKFEVKFLEDDDLEVWYLELNCSICLSFEYDNGAFIIDTTPFDDIPNIPRGLSKERFVWEVLESIVAAAGEVGLDVRFSGDPWSKVNWPKALFG